MTYLYFKIFCSNNHGVIYFGNYIQVSALEWYPVSYSLCIWSLFDIYTLYLFNAFFSVSFVFFAFCVSFWFVVVNLFFFSAYVPVCADPLIHAILIRSLFAFYTLHLLNFVSWISCWLVVMGEYPRKLSVYAPVYAFDCTLLLVRFLFVPHSIFLYVAFFNMEHFF